MRSRLRQLAVVLSVCVALGLGLLALKRLLASPVVPFTFQFPFSGVSARIEDPRGLWLMSLAPGLALALVFSLQKDSGLARGASLCLRLGFLFCLAASASGLSVASSVDRVCMTAVLDVSTSVSDASLERARGLISDYRRALAKADSFALIAFAQEAVRIPVDEQGRISLNTHALRQKAQGGATDLGRALTLASAEEQADCVARWVILTDGLETRGDAIQKMLAEPTSTRIYVEDLSEEMAPDVGVSGLQMPDDVHLGETFEVKVELSATRPAKGKVSLFVGNEPNALEPVKPLPEVQGSAELRFRVRASTEGPLRLRAVVEPEGPDRYPENNESHLTGIIVAPPKVMLVDSNPSEVLGLERALRVQGFSVELRSPLSLPSRSSDFDPFQFLILSDVSRAEVSRESEAALLEWVKRGGGLWFVGGEGSYGPGGWQGSELERALPVSVEAQKERETPGVLLALVIDRSGSMTGLPLEMAKEACAATLSVLSPSDRITVIAFDSKPVRFVKAQAARHEAKIRSEIERITPGGGTEIFASLDMAYQDLVSTEARKKHIILLTDGNASADGIAELATSIFADGISVTTVGLGTGINAETLKMIAELGGGRFHEVPDPAHLPRIFTRETEILTEHSELYESFSIVSKEKAPFLLGLQVESAPPLHGTAHLQLRPPPARAYWVSDRGEPVFAGRALKEGQILAWSSDLKQHYARDFLRWSEFPKWIGQTVRAHLHRDEEKTIPLTIQKEGDFARLSATVPDDKGGFDSGLQPTVSAELHAPGGKVTELPRQALELKAPGHYEGKVPLAELGSYTFLVEYRRRPSAPSASGQAASSARGSPSAPLGPVVHVSRGSLSHSYPEELRWLEPRTGFAQAWARLGRGEVSPAKERVARVEAHEKTHFRSRTFECLGAALILFLAELMGRRLRTKRA